jgi:5-methylcytosine-specific restriction endonuclease McrA
MDYNLILGVTHDKEMWKEIYGYYLESDGWKIKRKQKLKENGEICDICKGNLNLQIHHKTYKNVGDELMDDLQVLCRNCHTQVHNFPNYESIVKNKTT